MYFEYTTRGAEYGNVYRDKYSVFFPVLESRGIEVEFFNLGVGKTKRYCSSSHDPCHYGISLNYGRVFGRTKGRRYSGRAIKEKRFVGTKNSYNLQNVFDHIEEAIKFIYAERDEGLKHEKIVEIEKMSWDGMVAPELTEKNYTSNLYVDKESGAITYNGTYRSGRCFDEAMISFKEQFDTEGKKYIVLNEIKIKFENDYRNEKAARFETHEEMQEIFNEVKNITDQITNKLKEKQHGKKETT